ncbi:HAMP domain-containing sensor histidine kinase [Nocardiopsis sp. L17-MgMaSL7]|uniref:sensor histidine kinase n=1 Tax=Nocardiopsis sp. L17-MgMaSL7 TaxID=1938893 RepID=UPI000D70BACE|nr:HAMP domain-containing sensor histidine kinase [Nocardiopsis sp. L17-MgMaSL7]PWV57145.1 two-component system sensor histidine kinase VanS [Nocardiopsis sp. L17-MgMaSL7]
MSDGGVRVSARLRLTLGYAGFVVVAGLTVLVGVYAVLRFVPDYPLTAANPSDLGQPIAARGQILEAVVRISGGVLLVLAVIGLVGGWILAGWVLRPLNRINDAVLIAATGRLGHRVALSGRNDEFRQLADAFDHMLDRLQDAFEVQERFAANASHELRTPLAVNATLLDVARRDPEGQDHPRLLERLDLTNARAIGLTEALLRLADANAVTAVSEPADLAEIARGVLAEGEEEALRRGVRLEHGLVPAPTVGDTALLTQLTENLVRNALRHNTPGEGDTGTALVTTGRDRSTGDTFLRVENTGPVYTPETAARLHEPFLRGAGRIGSGQGHGLGLALVARVVRVHGGTLDLRPRGADQGGGLTVTVTLPARGAPQSS